MPYQAPGVRVAKVNGAVGTPAASTLKHGDLVNYEGVIGQACKSTQIDRWTLPANAQKIAAGEEFVIQVGGVVEAVAAGGLAAGAVGQYVNVAVSSGGTLGALTIGAAGATTLGVITKVDTTRTPAVLRINTNLP
jgi:hypothetical protein